MSRIIAELEYNGTISALDGVEAIKALRASLTEMLEVYWGSGDGHEPPPSCILRARAALKR